MLAIIPAKKRSKRLKNKNIKLLAGKPLISHTIEAAKKSKKITRIIVSTDCPKIAEIAKEYGAEVPFLRPKKLANDKTDNPAGLIKVCKQVINFILKKENNNISSFIILQPTSPLRLTKDIDKAVEFFIRKKADAVFSFSKAKPLNWHFHLNRNGNFIQVKKGSKISINNYLLNGAIFIYKTNFINKKINYNKKCFPFLMSKKRSIDIDNIDDFKYAEYLISKK